jgi:Uma2 family endonuclease
MATQAKKFYTPEEYLALEEAADYKSEYYAGEIFAMAGGSYEHVRITGNITGALYSRLIGGPCGVLPADMRVRVSPAGLYTYPDVVVMCGDPEIERNTLLNPLVLIEVLSESTEAYDRGAKFAQYQRIGSLSDYILVSQNAARVELFHRLPQGGWHYVEAHDVAASIDIPSLGVSLPLSEVYAGITFPPPRPEIVGGGADIMDGTTPS